MTIGGVRYLNARPLLYGLDRWCARLGGRLVEEVPSRLTDLLRCGDLDAALIPAIDAVCSADFCIIPGLCISSWGPVRSVRMWSNVPLDQIGSLALDTSSHSSAAMARVLLAELHGLRPQVIHARPHLDAMLEQADAALLIGDPGLRAQASTPHVLDLGEAWDRLVGLPFVFAVWAARRGTDLGWLPAALRHAREAGAAAISHLAAQGAAQLDLPVDVCTHYLTRAIRYDLDDDAVEGLQCLGEMAQRHGIIERYVEPEFCGGA